jgi:exopolyphosphatase/guanosine-5'-triphosphate,3'-diphosphate pyrophosphatase
MSGKSFFEKKSSAFFNFAFIYNFNIAMKQAVIDLGTNTFHLLIAETSEKGIDTVLLKENRFVQIGKGGINDGKIAPEAMQRAIATLQYFKEQLDKFEIDVKNVKAIATSAIRSANNQSTFLAEVKEKTGISVQIIDGNQEAVYIYEGVKWAIAIGNDPILVMDIGGGSVEFIIGNNTTIFWKISIEIGAQRLLDNFMQQDPILPENVIQLQSYLSEKLQPLYQAIQQYQPTQLIGSSGTFDTLCEMWYWKIEKRSILETDDTSYILPLTAFEYFYELLLPLNNAQRKTLQGMHQSRSEMIVVAVILLKTVLGYLPQKDILVSRYSLKEGVLAKSK